jgi:hypothetical protein
MKWLMEQKEIRKWKGHYFQIRKRKDESWSLVIHLPCFALGFVKSDYKQLSWVRCYLYNRWSLNELYQTVNLGWDVRDVTFVLTSQQLAIHMVPWITRTNSNEPSWMKTPFQWQYLNKYISWFNCHILGSMDNEVSNDQN